MPATSFHWRQWYAIARRRWRWLVLPPLGALLLSAVILPWMPRWYASQALLRVGDWRDVAAPAGSDAAAAATLAAAQLAASAQVVEPVVRRLRLAQTPEFRLSHRFQMAAQLTAAASRLAVSSWRVAAGHARAWGSQLTAGLGLLRAPPAPATPAIAPPHGLSTVVRGHARASNRRVGAAGQAAITAVILARLRVQPHAHSDLLDMRYRDQNPALAAGILQAIGQELAAQMRARAMGELRQQQEVLSAQAAAVKRHWQTAAETLTAFRAAHPADAAGPGQSAAMARLMALSQALTQAEIDLWRQQAVVHAGNHRGGARLDAETQRRLADLRLQRAQLAEQASRLEAQYGPAALPLVQARRALASVQASMRRYRRVLLSGHQVSVRTDRWEQVQLQAAVAREGALLATAERNAVQDQLLSSDVRARQDLYEQLWQKSRRLAVHRGLLRNPVQVLAPPQVPLQAMNAHRLLALTAATLLGLLAGLAAVVGMEAASPQLRRDNAMALGLPVLGQLPPAASASWDRSLDELWVTLLIAAGTDTTFLCTSSGPGAGKTWVARALGERLSRAGHSVLLVDCHFGAPRLTVQCATRPAPGLAEYLDGGCPLEALLQHSAPGAPAILPTGAWRPDLAGALASPAFAGLLGQLARRFDWVFLDGGPVEAQPEVRLLARAADAVLFIAGDGATPLARTQQAVQRLRLGAAKKMALIFNAAPPARGDARATPPLAAGGRIAARAAG